MIRDSEKNRTYWKSSLWHREKGQQSMRLWTYKHLRYLYSFHQSPKHISLKLDRFISYMAGKIETFFLNIQRLWTILPPVHHCGPEWSQEGTFTRSFLGRQYKWQCDMVAWLLWCSCFNRALLKPFWLVAPIQLEHSKIAWEKNLPVLFIITK